MNTVGKILVFLNLLFCVVVAGVLAYKYKADIDWKNRAESSEAELIISRKNNEIYLETLKKRDAQHALTKYELSKDLTGKEKIAEKADGDNKLLALKLAELELEKDALQKTQERAEENAKRLAQIKIRLDNDIKNRDLEIVNLHSAYNRVKVDLAGERSKSEAANLRVQALENQVRTLDETIVKSELARASLASLRDPNQPNPPSVSITGTIKKVDKQDNSFVEIALGTDHGLNKDHTLDVYRLKPRPEYLGMVKILSSEPHRSVGRLIRSAGVVSAVRADDLVSSDLKAK